MPWFKLKRAQRYEVTSKNSYVVCVSLLDNELMDCTLSTDSTGQECLENIAQRIGLNELEYFGLQYKNKKLQSRWVELEKPLKKQLDKYANSSMLYMAVQHYVASSELIQDEVSRYNYYLQLKNDVMEERVVCPPEKAILLAAYSLQVEEEDFDPERHEVQNIKETPMLPKTLSAEGRNLSGIREQILATYRNLQGVPSYIAEMGYIREVQHLEGFGLEYYQAKDDQSGDLLIGVSFVGVYMKRLVGTTSTKCLKWDEILHFSHNRRHVIITTKSAPKHFSFVMENPDFAKYTAKQFALQHIFYTNHPNAMAVAADEPDAEPNATGPMPDLAQSAQVAQRPSSVIESETQSAPGSFQPDNPLRTSERSFTNTTTPASSYQSSILSHPAAVGEYQQMILANDPTIMDNMYTSQMGPVMTNIDAVPPTHPPTPPQTYTPQSPSLPAYREAPDYDTVMQRRMQNMTPQNLEHMNNLANVNLSQAQVYLQPEMTAYSQPEISQFTHQFLNQSHIYSNGFIDTDGYYHHYRPVDRSNSLNVHPTYSTPELHMESVIMNGDLLHHYRPPPPYPRPSNSTPDLASQTTRRRGNIGDSPDLVSRRNINLSALVEQSRFDQSVENLTMEAYNLHLSQQFLQQQQQPQSPKDESSSFSNHIYANTPPVDTATYSIQSTPLPATPGANLVDYNHGHQVAVSHTNSSQGIPNSSPGTQTPQQASHQPPGQPMGQRSSVSSYKEKRDIALESPDISRIPSDHGSSIGKGSFTHSKTSSISSANEDQFDEEKQGKRVSMGPLKLAAMNGLSVSRASVLEPPHSDDSRAPKDERRKNLECRLEEGQVLVEFEQIPKKSGTEDLAIASRPDNKERNRFRDVCPYDRNRVKLAATKDNPTGYINGSHIKMSVKGEQFWYVATQGPLPNTVVDFWQMTWEGRVDVIAMLTDVVENGRPKCFQYWPMQIGPQHRCKFGDYQIQLQFVNDSGSYKTRGLQVRHIPTGEQRMVCHLQYTDWPDHGCPEDVYGFLGFIDEIESVRRTIAMDQLDKKPSPVIVHCSAGVGRSGVVVLTQIMKACLEHNVNVDVPTMLTQLRSQRMHLVQTVSQYSFVYKTLIQYLKNFRLI